MQSILAAETPLVERDVLDVLNKFQSAVLLPFMFCGPQGVDGFHQFYRKAKYAPTLIAFVTSMLPAECKTAAELREDDLVSYAFEALVNYCHSLIEINPQDLSVEKSTLDALIRLSEKVTADQYHVIHTVLQALCSVGSDDIVGALDSVKKSSLFSSLGNIMVSTALKANPEVRVDVLSELLDRRGDNFPALHLRLVHTLLRSIVTSVQQGTSTHWRPEINWEHGT